MNREWWKDPCECDECECDCLRDAYAKGKMRMCFMCREGDHEPHQALWVNRRASVVAHGMDDARHQDEHHEK